MQMRTVNNGNGGEDGGFDWLGILIRDLIEGFGWKKYMVLCIVCIFIMDYM